MINKIIEQIEKMKNPYPENIFMSDTGRAARVGWNICKDDVLITIRDEIRKAEEKAKEGKDV